MSILSNKIKNLRNYKVYDYALFEDDNKISPSKYPIFSKLFWSNRNVAISLDNYIGVILSKDDPSYLPYLRELFGDRKVYEVYLNHFYQKNRRLELIEEFLEI